MVVEADSPCQADKVIEADISLSGRSSLVADEIIFVKNPSSLKY